MLRSFCTDDRLILVRPIGHPPVGQARRLWFVDLACFALSDSLEEFLTLPAYELIH